ncbi:MAG: hypothetical protein ABJB86_23735 [Bacteroidota bacterium]
MKQVNSFMALCFITVFLLVVASCSKTGPTGPAGATGPAGPAGAAGAAGGTGAAGPAGTANVIYSAWLDVPYQYQSTTPGDTVWFGNIPAPKLDTNILTKGEMKVYWNDNYAKAIDIAPLPYNDGGSIILVNFEVGNIYLTANFNAGTGTDGTGKFWQYRYILVPGGTGARSAINWNNYAEVKKYLNLKD